MKKYILFLIFPAALVISCKTYELQGSHKFDYTTSGALTENCFQVIITMPPDKEFKTMTEQRESAFIKAKDSIGAETEKQILTYYCVNRSIEIESIPSDKLNVFKDKATDYSRRGIIDQEYYLIDNSAVLVYRIFKTGIKNEILNN